VELYNIQKEKTMNEEKTYATRDLALATYLSVRDIEVSGYTKDLKSWIFREDPTKCEELSLELRNHKAMVEILDYESARRNLLGMVPR
jgi:hypothetical protein